MKSAYELAMERLDKKHGKIAALTERQKKALAEIDQRVKAKTAELEIMYGDRIASAASSGNAADMSRLDAEMKAEISRARDQAESEKDAVRRDASLA